jgi:hypothetical protein
VKRRRAFAQVNVRHRGDVPEDDRQRSEVLQLLDRLRLDPIGPDFHRHPGVQNDLDRHRRTFYPFSVIPSEAGRSGASGGRLLPTERKGQSGVPGLVPNPPPVAHVFP